MARFGEINAQYFDDAGAPLGSGKLYFYESGTTTPKNTFSDINLTIPNTNPVILTAAGRQPNIFFNGNAKGILADKNDVQILVRDPIGETGTNFGDAWVATTIYSANAVVIGSDGVYYRSLANGNQNNNPTTTSGFWTLLYSVEWNAGITYDVGAVVTYDNQQYQSLQTSNLNQNPETQTAYWVGLEFAWIATATYAEDQNVVGTDGILYTSLQNSNTGNDPATSPAYWVGTSAAAAASAVAAAASAAAALVSENAAELAETNAETAQVAAEAAQAAAETAETNAETAETNSAASAASSATSASESATSAAAALASQNAAATSESNSASSAAASASSASAALASETAAAASEAAAATSESNAASSASSSASSASASASSASDSATSASASASSATDSANSATAAAGSATAAAGSATAAASSATAAAGSATDAADKYDEFDDRYLGDKASDPTLDNDGNALLTGALYFNTTTDVMRVYNGSAWQDTAISSNSPTFNGTTTTDGLDLSAIAESKAETAVDVFVYDTSQDSDGGAWRKRTQHTSWYNETLNTATRGSRKEFPAVAVIVAQSNKVTIYDGDDPSMPMWMVFNCNAGSSAMLQSNVIKAVAAKNGILQIASTIYGAPQVKFIEDYGDVYWNSGARRFTNLGISDRNATSFSISNDTTQNLINSYANDIAMTVLPNAPIDAATGLPVPTIAVATNGGVSVIKDDGTVVDSSSTSTIESIAFSESYDLVYGQLSTAMIINYYPSWKTDSFLLGEILRGKNSTSSTNYPYINTVSQGKSSVGTTDQLIFGDVDGLSLVTKTEEADVGTALVAYVTPDYNTGWMNGDIKLATLSDTDDTNITGSKLVTGDAASDDTNSIGSWINSGMSVLESSTNFTNGSTYALHFTANSNGDDTYVSFPTVIGKTYTISFDAYATNYTGTSTLGTFIGTSATGNQYTSTYGTVTAASTWTKYTATFTATTTTAYLTFIEGGTSNNIDAYIDNLSVRLAVEDRSVNDNGLQVFGTITKTPVASGADLVAYSGFSASNYLEQPYNSDLDFGTGNFCKMGWVYNTSFASRQTIFRRNDIATGGDSGRDSLTIEPSGVFQYGIATGVPQISATCIANAWQHVAITRSSGSISIYVNGILADSDTESDTVTSSTSEAVLRFGCLENGSLALLYASLALWRISATAPTAEQIAKIYEDEKFLFQENSQATLYGSSDSVTALAYDDDTELLHVGTSAGRSVFQGLRRVDNTTDAVGAAISASNGLVAED